MAHTNSPLGQLVGVVPALGDAPNVQPDLLLMATEVEKKVNMSFASRAARDAAVTSPVDGMETYIQDVDEVDKRVNGAWAKIWPIRYYGTTDPLGTLGVVGDIYLKY